MYREIRALQILDRMLKLVKMTLEHYSKKELKQRSFATIALFNLLLEEILRKTTIRTRGTMYNSKNEVLAYVDDIVLMFRTKVELIKTFKKLFEKQQKHSLRMNE